VKRPTATTVARHGEKKSQPACQTFPGKSPPKSVHFTIEKNGTDVLKSA
jgi:hypothetical protein